jgi:hypothetical protein
MVVVSYAFDVLNWDVELKSYANKEGIQVKPNMNLCQKFL